MSSCWQEGGKRKKKSFFVSVRVLKSTVWILGAVSLLGSVKDEEKQCGITLQVLTQTGAVPKAALGGAAWPRLLSSLFNVLRIQSHQPSYSCNTHFLFLFFLNPAVSPPYCEESDFYPYGVNVCLSPSYIAFIDWSRSSRGGNGDWNDRLLFSCATGLNSIYWQNSTAHSCRVMKPSVIRQVQGLWPTSRQVIF